MDIQKTEICDRPREKLLSKGSVNLSNSELLAILLRTGTRGQDVYKLAANVESSIGFFQLPVCPLESLTDIVGISYSKACTIKAAIEIGDRLFNASRKVLPEIQSPSDVLSLFCELRNLKKEHFWAIYLNSRNQINKFETISIGTLDASLVHPREVFEPALTNLAAKIIIVHNHPSNDVRPSEADKQVTARLVEVGNIMGIAIIDHLIISRSNYFSFQQENLIKL